MKYPLCFPVYKHRKTTILDRLDGLENPPDKIYCFMYDFDKENYNLDDYKGIKNLTIVSVPDEYKSSMKMRLFMQNYLTEQGVKKFWMLDDDVSNIQVLWKQENKGHINKVNLTEAYEYIENYSDENDISLIGPTLSSVKFYWAKGINDFSGNGMPAGATLINNEKLLSAGVHYTGDASVNEDYEIWINTRRAGLKAGTLDGVLLKLSETENGRGSWVANEANFKIHLNNYLKFGNDFKLFWNEKTDDICATRPRGRWVEKERTWHQGLVDKCHEYLNEKITKEDFKNYLLNLGKKY